MGFSDNKTISYGVLENAVEVYTRLTPTATPITYDFIVEHRVGDVGFVTFVPTYPDLIALLNLITPSVINYLHADLLHYQIENEEQRRLRD